MRIGKKLVYSIFGSHVYGTSTPKSDRDYKGVMIPDASDIILQRANKTSINQKTKDSYAVKNTCDDVDTEIYSLQAFIRLLVEGQTAALDLLFTPKEFILESSEEWAYLQANRKHLIHRGTAAFFGYAQQQAAKYGIKGSRVASVRQALCALKDFDKDAKMSHVDLGFLQERVGDSPHIAWVFCNGPTGVNELHLEVCNRKIPIHARFKYAVDVLQRIFDEYGKRALAAEQNENVDCKALSHAVRVCCEAKELLDTGHITFPRPEADMLLKIKLGEMSYKEVAPMIEEGLVELEDAKAKSKLPEAINQKKWEQYILMTYSSHLITGFKNGLFLNSLESVHSTF